MKKNILLLLLVLILGVGCSKKEKGAIESSSPNQELKLNKESYYTNGNIFTVDGLKIITPKIVESIIMKKENETGRLAITLDYNQEDIKNEYGEPIHYYIDIIKANPDDNSIYINNQRVPTYRKGKDLETQVELKPNYTLSTKKDSNIDMFDIYEISKESIKFENIGTYSYVKYNYWDSIRGVQVIEDKKSNHTYVANEVNPIILPFQIDEAYIENGIFFKSKSTFNYSDDLNAKYHYNDTYSEILEIWTNEFVNGYLITIEPKYFYNNEGNIEKIELYKVEYDEPNNQYLRELIDTVNYLYLENQVDISMADFNIKYNLNWQPIQFTDKKTGDITKYNYRNDKVEIIRNDKLIKRFRIVKEEDRPKFKIEEIIEEIDEKSKVYTFKYEYIYQ